MRAKVKKPGFPQDPTMEEHANLLIYLFRAQGLRVDGKCKVSKISVSEPSPRQEPGLGNGEM